MERREPTPRHQPVESAAQAVDQKQCEQDRGRDRCRRTCAGELCDEQRERVAAERERNEDQPRLQRGCRAYRFAAARDTNQHAGTPREGGDRGRDRECAGTRGDERESRDACRQYRLDDAPLLIPSRGCAGGCERPDCERDGERSVGAELDVAAGRVRTHRRGDDDRELGGQHVDRSGKRLAFRRRVAGHLVETRRVEQRDQEGDGAEAGDPPPALAQREQVRDHQLGRARRDSR